jgi:hypothetical protein
MKKPIIYLLLFGLCACDLVVDVDIPLGPNRLTINSLFHPDSTWLVMLSNNQHILNDSSYQPSVENAIVVVVEDGVPADTLVYENYGFYRSQKRPSVGKEYQLIVRRETSEIITGPSTIIKPETVKKVELIKGVETGHGRLNNKINVTFADKSLEPNYYQIVVKTEHEQIDFRHHEKVLSFPGFVRLESDDPSIQSQIINQYEGLVIKDVLFNGREVTLSFKTPENDLFQEGAVIVSLRTLSPEYYHYKTTASLQEHTSGDPFAQPVNVYSNVKNGYGIFAGFSQSEHYEEIYPRPVITGVTPSKGKPGDHIIISGLNFTDRAYGVTFKNDGNWAHVEIVRIGETEIEVIVPQGAITGKIAFYNHGRVAVSPEAFEVIP